MSSTAPFKAIVIGSGPIGLVAAHALTRSGIDFTVLEQRSNPVIDAGANLVLTPLGMRALYQLGLYEELNKVSDDLTRMDYIDHEGRDIAEMKWFELDKEHFGAFPRIISRHDLTKTLYSTLPAAAQAKFQSSKKVTGINTTSEGAVVDCADGSSYKGSIVIGADGAHSMVRNRMRELAVASGSPNVNEEKPYLTTYRAMWIRFPKPAQSAVGVTCETHGYGAATQIFTGKETGVAGLYERLEEPTKERIRFTKDDERAIVERWGHLPVTKSGDLTVRDVYDSRVECGLVSLEEGVVQNWSWDDRIVLVGDAAHKFTPSTGAGCNNGIIDIVALVNELNRAISQNPSQKPTKAQLMAAFKAYQDCRFDAVTAQEKESGSATSMATWTNGFLKFMDLYVLPFQTVQKLLSKKGASTTAAAPAFDFVEEKEYLVGKVPWKTPMIKA